MRKFLRALGLSTTLAGIASPALAFTTGHIVTYYDATGANIGDSGVSLTTGPSAAVAGSIPQVNSQFVGPGSQNFNTVYGASYPGKTWAGVEFSNQITGSTFVGGTPSTSNGAGLVSYLDVHGAGANFPGVAVVGWVSADLNGDVGFAFNGVCSSAAGVTVQLTCMELDTQAQGTLTSSYDLAINNYTTPIAAAIYIRGLSGGTYVNGIVIGEVTGAAFAPAAGTTIGHLIDTGTATYTNSIAIILQNTHLLELAAFSGANPTLGVNSSNDLLLTLPAGGLTIEGSGANVSVDNSGDLTAGGVVAATTLKVSAATPTVATGSIGFGNTLVVAGAGTCPSGTIGGQTAAGCFQVNIGGTNKDVPYF